MLHFCLFLGLIFLLLFSGSAALAGRSVRFEQSFPCVCTGLILVLFVCGLLDLVRVGFWLVCALTLGFWAAALLPRGAEQRRRQLRAFFTPAFFAFLVMAAFFAYINYRKMICGYDELSHWGDAVKVLIQTGKFGVYPAANALHPQYPPADTLMLYLFEALYNLIFPGDGYREDILYVAHLILTFAFLLPFFTRPLAKGRALGVLAVIAVVFSPCAFLDVYTGLMADTALSILLGCGMAALFLNPFDSPRLQTLYLCCACALLVLMKSVGLLFAVLLAVTAAIRFGMEAKTPARKKYAVYIALSTLIPAALWKLKCALGGARASFSTKLGVSDLLALVAHRDSSYRQAVYDGFWTELNKCTFGKVPMLLLILGMFAALALLCRFLRRRGIFSGRDSALLLGSTALVFPVYLYGLCLTYCFSFTQEAAEQYASLLRYAAIVCCFLWLLVLLAAIYLAWEPGTERIRRGFCALLLACALLYGNNPVGVLSLLTRFEAHRSQYARVRSAAVEEYFLAHADEEPSRVFLVTQDRRSYDMLLMHYVLRPNYVPQTWQLGEEELEQEGYMKTTPDEWRTLLVSDYDYVVVMAMDDYFTDNYAHLFSGTLEQGSTATLWKVDKDSGTLNCVVG